MIRFKQRMSLCSEVSNDGSASPSIAFERQAQTDSGRRHSPPVLPPVPAVSININIGHTDSSSAALGLPPSSSSDSSLASSCFGVSNDGRASMTSNVPMSHVEIPPIESKIHDDDTNSSSSNPGRSSAPPAAAMAVTSTATTANNQVAGTKRKVSDATDGEDSSSSHTTHVDDSDNSSITTTTGSKKSKRPRIQDSADSPLHEVPPPPQPRLLACPSDHLHLPPVHCFVRRQIEVFAATSEDVAAPRPGRKVRIQQGQVGLRCIHCKRAEVDAINEFTANNAKQKRPKRIKRAVCYPSQISRIYSSVSDMKFDHFAICPHMPMELREELATLKASHVAGGGSSNVASSSASSVASTSSAASSASSTSTSRSISSSSSSSAASTARYYRETARLVLGLVDVPASEGSAVGGGGIRFGTSSSSSSSLAASSDGVMIQPSQSPPLPTTVDIAVHVAPKKPKRSRTAAAAATTTKVATKTLPQAQDVVPTLPCVPIPTKVPTFPQQVNLPLPLTSPIDDNTTTTTTNDNKTFLLAAPEDEQILNPIHCFVRRNVEVFAATSEDIAAPAPGRKNRVVVGQVGIRCVHCAHLPQRDRVKRSICYPPNVSGIYHAVSNMKFDHFASCKGLDAETRAEFQTLRATCGRKGGGRAAKSSTGSGRTSAAARGTTSSSTAQYYHDSAQNLGLVDTRDGIRFLPEEAAKLRAAAAMVIQAHQEGPPPTSPPMVAAAPVPTKVQFSSTATSVPLPPLGNAGLGISTAAITPDQPKYPTINNFAHREPIPDGLSALMMAASQRSAEYAPQSATTKLAV